MKSDSFKSKGSARDRTESNELSQIQDDLADLQTMHGTPSDEPPMMLDQAVKNMARRELELTPPVKKNPMFWVTGLSTASIALIALGISLVQNPSPPGPVSDMPYRQNSEQELPKEEARKTISTRMMEAPATMSAEAMKSDLATPAVESSLETLAADEQWRNSATVSSGASLDSNRDRAPETQAQQAMNDSVPSATAWLERIRQVHSDGLQEDAQQLLADFLSAYPEYPLPDWAKEIQELQD